jgi:voltage-gated potassium channel|tara:strand:- start:135 stop:848 length:714 start_codon:yes stop_codon:yes gene_type:complete
MERLRKVVEETGTRSGLVFDLSIQLLIIASIVIFSLETLPNLNDRTVIVLSILESVCITVFAIEYLLRLFVAKRKLKFVFSLWGMIDLLAILPFFLFAYGITLNLIILRAFRLLRLVRILKLGRYSKSLSRMVLAMKIAREDLLLALAATLIMLLVASFGIYQFENPVQPEKFSSVFESLWWALATLTTVGYGDIYPITLGGRIFTGFILMIGLGIVALPAGIIASSLTEARKQQDD